MWTIVAGSVFWALLVLLPVTVQESYRCVTNKHRGICALKGSSIDFPCTVPKGASMSSLTGWSRLYGPEKRWKPLQQISAYSSRIEVSESGCMLRLKNLKKIDTSIYHLIYSSSNATGHTSICLGDLVRLTVFDWAVRISVGAPMSQQDSWVMIEGQRVILTCKPTCKDYVNSNSTYIWYKNRWQLDVNKTSSYLLSLDSISLEDTGSYVCAMVGYENHPSSAVNLQVQRRQSSTWASTTTTVKTQTPTYELSTQNSTDQPFNSYQTPQNKGMVWNVSILLATGVSVGLIVGIIITVIITLQKMKRKRRQRTNSLPKHPDPNCDIYMALDVSLVSPDYETLNIDSSSSPEYETMNIVSSSPKYETVNIVSSSPEYETMNIGSSSPDYETMNIGSSSPDYETVDIVSSSPEYETMNIVKHCSVAETVCKNYCQHENSK